MPVQPAVLGPDDLRRNGLHVWWAGAAAAGRVRVAARGAAGAWSSAASHARHQALLLALQGLLTATGAATPAASHLKCLSTEFPESPWPAGTSSPGARGRYRRAGACRRARHSGRPGARGAVAAARAGAAGSGPADASQHPGKPALSLLWRAGAISLTLPQARQSPAEAQLMKLERARKPRDFLRLMQVSPSRSSSECAGEAGVYVGVG